MWLLLLCSVMPHDMVITDHVAVIQFHTYLNNFGANPQRDYIIFYDYYDVVKDDGVRKWKEKELHIVAYRTLTPHVEYDGHYVCLFQDYKKFRKVTAEKYIRTTFMGNSVYYNAIQEAHMAGVTPRGLTDDSYMYLYQEDFW